MRLGVPARVYGVICALALSASSAAAATINVPAGGDLQQAINNAQPGDIIALASGATYVGNFVLPNKGALNDSITIRTAVPDASLPPANVRMTPAYAGALAKIRSSNSMSAVRTLAGANHYVMMLLEFQANAGGYGDIIGLGAGDSTQTQLSQVPYALTLDRVYVHGDPVMGQKRGIALHSGDTTIVNSWVSDCKAVGQEAQAISGFNGTGPYLIENNYLEGSTQDFLLGGADPTIPNLVTTNVTFRRNYLSKQLAWKDPIIATPAAVAATPAAGSGSLAAGTYSYKVAARVAAGQTTRANSTASAEVSATLASAGGVTISWTPVVGATDYVVYGRAAGSENVYWTTTNPYFTDTGAVGTAGTPTSATKWYVKNVFELKNAQDVVVEGNVFENLWVAAQPGYPIVFTPRNQSGTAPWVVVQRVTFQHNLVRHAAGGVNILGTDNVNPSRLTNHITVRDNIFDDLTASTWGSGSRPFQLGDGPDSVTIDHNTVVTTNSSIVWMYGGSATAPTAITNAVYTNNMSVHNTYGMDGSNFAAGLSSINAYMPGASVAGNVLAGGTASKYPTGNFFPTVSAWQGSFVNYASGDYHLAATSAYRNAGTDGRDLGADVDGIAAQAANALSGDNRLAPGTPKVQITTTSLPDGVLNQTYAKTVACSANQCGWQIVDATLPSGLSFDIAVASVTGTPTAVQTGNITVLAYDAAAPANSATATLSVTVDAPPFGITMPASDGQVGVPYVLTPAISGAMGTVTWSVLSGALPDGLAFDPWSGAIAGVPTRPGVFTAAVLAQDTWRADRTATATLAITVAPAPLVITTTTLGNGSYQQPFQVALNATGGSGSATWSVVAGTLPGGVLLANNVIAGTPTTPGVFNVTVQAVDANYPALVATASLALTIDAPAFTASAPSSASGQVGTALQFQAAAAGNVGSVSWTMTGALPPGVSMDANGFVSGAPGSYGSFTATFVAHDSYDLSRVASATTTIAVAPPAMSIPTASLPAGQAKQSYLAPLAATGGTGTFTWAISDGSLPAGLTLTSNGVVSGIPTAAGTASVTVTATDSGWPGYVASRSLSIVVAAAPPTNQALLDDTFDTLDRAKWPGSMFTSTADTGIAVGAGGGVLQIGPLKSATGSHYAGINSAAYDMTSGGFSSVQLIQPAAADSYTMFAAGFDSNNYYRWYVSAGQLVAERRVAGTKTTLLTAPYDAIAHQFLRIRVDVDPSSGSADVVFETAPNNGGFPGVFSVFYSEPWSAAVTLTAIRFELKAGTSTAVAAPGSAQFDNFHAGLSAVPPALAVVTAALPDGQVHQAYSAGLNAVGSVGATTWVVSSGALPAGLTLSSDGIVSGTPTAIGASPFTVTATDAMWPEYPATQTLSIMVGEQVLLADAFDALDRTKWPGNTFTSTPDPAVPVAASGGALQVGPMLASMTGSHYAGINSAAFDITSSGSASAQLTQPGNGLAYAMFAAGYDGNNYYRWYVSGGQIVAERRLGGTKKSLLIAPYDGSAQQFLRIRNDVNAATGASDVVFETAPNNSGVPGAFTVFYREAWDARVVTNAIKFELKGGTSDAIASPGSVRFDNFKATRR
jgi:hypothetical protein